MGRNLAFEYIWLQLRALGVIIFVQLNNQHVISEWHDYVDVLHAHTSIPSKSDLQIF